jgi:hypothetical protein
MKPASPVARTAGQLRTVASREEAPPAPAPAARECAPDRRSSAPADEPPLPVCLPKVGSSAPKAVTTTQCCIMRSHPPPAQSSGTRRLTVRSPSLAALHAIVSSYLLPMEWRLRSCLTAPHEAQAARPPGTAPMSSRHASGQPHSAPHAAVMPAAPAARCRPKPTTRGQ